MHHPVVRPAEAEHFQLVIGVADEIAIGKEQQFDDIPAQFSGLRRRRSAFDRPRIGAGRGTRKIYVSHVDISWVQCYKTTAAYEILDRFAFGHAPSVNLVTVRLSSGISANILDFAHSAKAETGLKHRLEREPGVKP
jgi:hypothetical protein